MQRPKIQVRECPGGDVSIRNRPARVLWRLLSALVVGSVAVASSSQAVAQAPCYAENDGPDFADLTCSSPFQNCIQFTAIDDYVVTRIEVFTGETSGMHEVSLWSQSPVGLPDVQLSQGTWAALDANQWQGADLDSPVQLFAGETYFVGWHPSGFCSQSSLMPPGTGISQTFYWSMDGLPPWNGPYTESYKYRLICGDPFDAFQRGDVNVDGAVDISDMVFALAALFVPGSAPVECDDAADLNDDGGFDVSDAVYGLSSLFVPGSPPAPAPVDCADGGDPTDDSLDCASFDVCP